MEKRRNPSSFPCQRIVVIGTTSSGKSTLAKALAERLGLRFVELDALYWGPDWTPASLEAFRESVRSALICGEEAGGWVVAGNYHVVRDLIWPKAEAIIWLDYSFPLVFWRLLTRTIRRAILKEELWNGNVERFLPHLKLWSEDSLFHWLFKSYWRRKRETPRLLAQPAHTHLRLLRFQSPQETEEWLSRL